MEERNVIRAKLDIIFKKMFIENTDLLHDFLAAMLEMPLDAIKDIEVKNPEILPDAIEGKLSRMDIKMRVDDRVINAEMQISYEPDYRDRALFLWSKLYTGELKSGDEYEDLKQSICLNIIAFNMFKCREFHSHFAIMEKTRHEVLTDKCGIHFFELKKISKEVNPHDKMELWLQLINAETKEEFAMLEQTGDAPIQKAVYTLHQMSEDERLAELAWQREVALHDHVSRMNYAERKGLARGIAKGEAAGRAKGEAEGRASKSLEIAQNLLGMGMPIEQIEQATGLTRAEIEGLHTVRSKNP
jgi:predicted transposase/invertase (TIGR01784 family)